MPIATSLTCAKNCHHRWDLVGDDDEGDEILARPELIDHAVRILGDPLLRVGLVRDQNSGEPFTARIRSPRQPDLVVEVRPAGSRLVLVEEPEMAAEVECDAAAVSSSCGDAGRPQPSASERHWIPNPSPD